MSACPISLSRTDIYNERIEAFFAASILSLFLLSCSFVMPLLLTIEYVLKLITKNRYSLFRPLSNICKKAIGLPSRMVDDGPKRFARTLGAILSINLIALYSLNLHEPALLLATLFIIFALMEAIFNFCIGCKIYIALNAIRKKGI